MAPPSAFNTAPQLITALGHPDPIKIGSGWAEFELIAK